MDNEEGTIKRTPQNIKEANELYDLTSEFPKPPEGEENENI